MRPEQAPRVFVMIVLFSLLAAWPKTSRAQSDADRAAAQALFEEGHKLKENGQLAKACAKFQGSQKLDPAVGTQLNLADCYEQIGKTASAWIHFSDVADNPSTDSRRAQFARKRADALKGRLVRLVLEVEAPVANLVLRRGDEIVPRETWGTPIPVDPGLYEIVATAERHEAWRKKVDLSSEGETVTVAVPPLVELDFGNFDDEAPKPEPVEEASGSGQAIAGGVVLALGAGGLIAGAVLAGLAHGKAAESEDHCLPEDPNACFEPGVTLREEAQRLQVGYAVSFAAGGALVVAGLITLLTAPSDGDGPADEASLEVVPWFEPTSAGLSLGGRF